MFDSKTAVSTTCNFHITSFRPFYATTFNTVTSEHGVSHYSEELSHFLNEAFAAEFDTWCPKTDSKICDLGDITDPLEQNNSLSGSRKANVYQKGCDLVGQWCLVSFYTAVLWMSEWKKT